MKKIMCTIFLFLLMASLSYAQDLTCQILVNTEIASESTVELEANSKIFFGEVEGYRFTINSLGNSKYELEIFDPGTPSRSYSSGLLKTIGDKISWTYWSREIMIESNCRLSGSAY